MTSEAISFSLDQPQSEATLIYRPWSTRTLKVRVSTGAGVTAPLRLRPRGMRPGEMEAGIFRAYAFRSADDQSEDGLLSDFVISWGGGHEEGPCVKAEDFLMAFEKCAPLLPAEEEAEATSILFFNVTHEGPNVPETAVLILEAYDPETQEAQATLTVTLQKPAGLLDDVVRFKPAGNGRWQPNGDMLPFYDPRWWPRKVEYVPAGDLPLTIERRETTLSIQWAGEEIATITDNTKPSILDMDAISFELFHFDEWHVALRVWFFWTDTSIGNGFFIGRHEVPDAERFDFLIRRADGVVTLACTDLHWREVWGEVERDQKPEATLGLTREVKMHLAEEKLGKLWQPWKRDEKLDHDRSYDPMRYIERLAEERGKEQAGVQRAKGTEAHLPMLHHVEQRIQAGRPPRMTSSDVRMG